jgi:hypothetical protein
MTKVPWSWLVAAITFTTLGCSRGKTITQDELVRRTQEGVDAVASGDHRPFEKYLAADSMIFDERGQSLDTQNNRANAD